MRFAPRDALLRDIERTEDLAADLVPDGVYPDDWVIFRITGYRRDRTSTSIAPGSALLSDLSAFVERLCHAAGLKERDHPSARFESPESICRRWKTSRKTLDRERRNGLVARRIAGADGKARIVFRRDVVERFEAARAGRAHESLPRIDRSTERKMIARARRYHRCVGLSLNASAKRIAARFGRSHEAVRQLLLRAEQHAPIFSHPGPLDSKKRAVAHRAWGLGVDIGLIASRFRRSRSGVRRAINLVRAAKLRSLAHSGALNGPTHDSFHRGDAQRLFLSAVPVTTGLGAPGMTDLLDFIAGCRSSQPPIGVEEHARAAAYHFLRHWCAKEIRLLDHLHPSARSIDLIETRLRWAARLKAELIRPQWRLALQTIEVRLGKPAEETPPALLVRLLNEAVLALSEAVDHFDPFHRGRLAAPAGMAVDRMVSRVAREFPAPATTSRRAVTLLSRGIRLHDWTRHVAPWQAFLEPDRRLRDTLESCNADSARFLTQRFGWSGEPPRTLEELGARFRLSPIRVVRFERECLSESLRLARKGG